MPSGLSGINVALQALLAHQQSIEVIEHNVANANTPGFHRQSAVLQAGIPTSFSNLMGFYAGEMGTGVTVDNIMRYNLQFFDRRYRNEISDAKRWELESGVLQQIEATLGEAGTDGLTAKLDSFWQGWQNLSVDPSSTALKADVLQRSKELAEGIQTRYTKLTQIQIDQNAAFTQSVNDINAKAEQIAQLNVEISHMLGTNQQPNDLMDQRDMLVDQIAELTGSRADEQPNGMVTVSINGHSLVSGAEVHKLVATQGTLLTTVAWDNGDAFSADSGQLKALQDLRDNVIPQYQASLDKLALNLANEVNSLHNPASPATHDPVYAAGMNFFTYSLSATPDPTNPAKGAAASLAVNTQMENLDNILGASAAYPSDGSIATSIAGLQNQTIANLGNIRFNEYTTQKAAELGLFTRQAESYSNDRSLVVKALEDQRQSLEGVNLDEEAANLVKAQKAFQAATRMVNVMDDLMNRIINGMGRAGL